MVEEICVLLKELYVKRSLDRGVCAVVKEEVVVDVALVDTLTE